jgi:radical SAM superfamily enzyme
MSDLQEKIEALVFYCPNNESGELFRATCSFCYQMNGHGPVDKAEILYQWAKEMAEDSKKWVTEEGEIEDAETENGIWGY